MPILMQKQEKGSAVNGQIHDIQSAYLIFSGQNWRHPHNQRACDRMQITLQFNASLK